MPIDILFHGVYARARLAAATTGRVVARFEHSLYFDVCAGGMSCVGDRRIGRGPINIGVGSPDWASVRSCAIGDVVRADTEHIVIGRGRVLRWRDAAAWSPRMPSTPIRWGVIERRLQELRALAVARAPDRGLSRFVIAPASPRIDPVLARAAAPGLDALRSWLAGGAAREASVPDRACEALVGLGPGLTPAGDDLLGAVMIALRALGRGAAADAMWGWLQPAARTRTSAIAMAHLAAAACGQGHETVHAVLHALADERRGLDGALDAIGGLGHSSGWDALAGILLTYEAIVGAQRAARAAASSAA